MNVLEEEAKELLIAKGKLDLLNHSLHMDIQTMSDMQLAGVLGRLEDFMAEHLDEKMIIVLEKYYGLKDGERCSDDEIAKELNTTSNSVFSTRSRAEYIMMRYQNREELLYGKLDKSTVALIRSETYKLVDSSMTIKRLTHKMFPMVGEINYDIPIREIEELSIGTIVNLSHAGIKTLQDVFTVYQNEGWEGFLKIRDLKKRHEVEILEILKKYSQIKESDESSADTLITP